MLTTPKESCTASYLRIPIGMLKVRTPKSFIYWVLFSVSDHVTFSEEPRNWRHFKHKGYLITGLLLMKVFLLSFIKRVIRF